MIDVLIIIALVLVVLFIFIGVVLMAFWAIDMIRDTIRGWKR